MVERAGGGRVDLKSGWGNEKKRVSMSEKKGNCVGERGGEK